MNLSIDEFLKCGCQEIVEKSVRENRENVYHNVYFAIENGLRSAADCASTTGSTSKIFLLLADACSMSLVPYKRNSPYEPVVAPQSSAVGFFAEISATIENFALRARVADLAWLFLQDGEKKLQNALLAIDAYMQFSISPNRWGHDSRDSWERAIVLCKSLKGNQQAKKQLQKIEMQLFIALSRATRHDADRDDAELALSISELFLRHEIFCDDLLDVGKKISQLGDASFTGDFWVDAKRFYEQAVEIFKVLKDDDLHAEMLVKAAECWAREAELQSPDSRKADYYEKAIRHYRNVPKRLREKYDVDEKRAALEKKVKQANKHSVGGMSRIIMPMPIDSGHISEIENSVKGRSVCDALAMLANIFSVSVGEIRKLSKKIIEENPLYAISPEKHFSADGRKIATHRGVDPAADGDDEKKIFSTMLKIYRKQICFAVQAYILPALNVVRQEHQLHEQDLCSLIAAYPVLLQSRKKSVAKALVAGYCNDFISALHILAPQLENIIRVCLRQHGIDKTGMSEDGVQNESALSTLMALPETEKVFGANLAFEIRALFCEQLGPNFRNHVAHGLADDRELESAEAVYAWWFFFRLIFRGVPNSGATST